MDKGDGEYKYYLHQSDHHSLYHCILPIREFTPSSPRMADLNQEFDIEIAL